MKEKLEKSGSFMSTLLLLSVVTGIVRIPKENSETLSESEKRYCVL